MYHLNRKLIERLPKLLRISKKEICSRLGIDHRQYSRWVEGGFMSVKMLEKLSNTVRISLSEFIVVHENPPQRSSVDSYVIPLEEWKEVKWKGEAFQSLFGEKGILKVSKALAAKRIGISSGQHFDLWSERDSGMDVHVLIRFLNEFKLSASLFFSDPNGVISVPLWVQEEGPIVERLKTELQMSRQAELRIRECERRIGSYREENARLKKENEILRKKIEQMESSQPLGFLAERPQTYQTAKRSGWRFHKELWQSIPSMFEMSVSDFCRRFGIRQSSTFILVENIQVRLLVDVCNAFRMSVSSFFLRDGEVSIVRNREWYEISKSLFKPIENHAERMEYIFGRWSVFKYSKDDLCNRTGVGYRKSLSMKDKELSRVLTLSEICSEFGLSPMLFFEDDNKKSVDFFSGRNERLILNAIEMAKELRLLRGELWRKKKP